MEHLKQVNPDQWQQTPELHQFYDDLASKPYCTNAKGFCYIRSKSHAIRHSHIQPNHPAICKWLAFDIDDPNALFTCFDEGLPPPQIIIKNPTNGHAHYLYRLTTPIGTGGNSSMKAVRYLASVQKALASALGADSGYSGNLIKNPCHSDHETYLTGAQPSYTLAELANHLDLEPLYAQATQEPANDIGYGRNVGVFDHVRHKAYPIAQDLSYRELERILTAIAKEFNQRFDIPLPPNELKHIIKSITKFCKSPRFGAYSEKFKEKQREDGRMGGRASNSSNGGKARSAKYSPLRKQAEQMHKQGVNKSEIARKLGISRRTAINWLASKGCESASQSDNSPLGVFCCFKNIFKPLQPDQQIGRSPFLTIISSNSQLSSLILLAPHHSFSRLSGLSYAKKTTAFLRVHCRFYCIK